MLENEKELRRPLGDNEIREGVAVKVAQAAYDAVYDAVIARLEASGGRLYGQAYPSFKGSGALNLRYFLDWRGEELTLTDEQRAHVIDNHTFEVGANTVPYSFVDGEAVFILPDGQETKPLEIPVSIPETPPNVFRKETGQSIPVASTSGGKTTEKHVRYQPRRK